MNRKQKKELRRRLSTRQLMGIDQLTEHGLKTAKGELVFFLLSPDNLSVLSPEGVMGRVRALTDLLRSAGSAELLGLNDHTDFKSMRPEDFPILSDLYEVMEDAYQNYEQEKDPLYPRELLQEVLLGLHSMCRGAESKFFNGHTNVTSHRFLVFGVKDLINGSLGVRNAMLFNLLSYLSDKLLTEGRTVAGLDELYIWLSNPTAVEYIRNTLKRVRKKESALIMASQNLEDFDVPGVREMTRPLFAIPTHQFLFNAGNVDKRFYMDNLQLEASEFELIAHPQNGVCLFKCGNERYLLEVHAPEHIRALFGEAGGR